MSFIYNAAPIDFNTDEQENNSLGDSTNPNAVFRKKLMKNRTIKKNVNNEEYNENAKRVESIMKALHSKKNHKQTLGKLNFPQTQSAKLINNDAYHEIETYDDSLVESNENDANNQNDENNQNDDNDITVEGYNNMSNNNTDYYSNYLPYYSNASNSNTNKLMNENEIYKKLDYLIHLIEEIKDEKTNNVTEELVLYSFLGVFIIFIVDSFARAGKYAR